jgi:small subunit ribosomal protein S21
MATVNLHPERQTLRDIDNALRRFKRAVEADGTLKDLQDKREFIKPSIQTKLKKAAAKARWRRELAKHKLPEKQY